MYKCNLLTPNHKLHLYQVNFNIVSDFPLALWTTSRALEAGPFKLRVTLNSSSSLVTLPHSLKRRETQWSCPTAEAHDLCHTFNTGHVTCFSLRESRWCLTVNFVGFVFRLMCWRPLTAWKMLVWWVEGPGGVLVTKCVAPAASFCVTEPT